MSADVHQLGTKVGVLVGEESTHGVEASLLDIIPGQSVVFAEAVSENKIEIYDPAAGQSLQCVVPGALDIAGAMNFFLVDWRWLYWAMGTDAVDEIQGTATTGTFDTSNVCTGGTSGATFTPTVVSGTNPNVVLTTGTITGTPVHGETFTQAVSGATLDVGAFIHDLAFNDILPSLSVVNIFDDLTEGEKYLGMRINEATLTSARGEIIVVDLDFVGLSELTDATPETRTATTKCAWVWNKGSVVIDGVDYDNVCDNLTMKIMRNVVARGGHNRNAHEVVAGTRKVEMTFDMDLPDSVIRVLRRANTTSTVVLDFVNIVTDDQAEMTLTNVYITEDSRDSSRDAETVRVSVIAVTGDLAPRIYDDIFDYSS